MATITTNHAEQIAELIADAVGEDLENVLRTDYSGRGMYGRECIGFIAEPAMVIAAIAESDPYKSGELGADLLELASEVRTDSMGFNTITYLPGWSIED